MQGITTSKQVLDRWVKPDLIHMLVGIDLDKLEKDRDILA